MNCPLSKYMSVNLILFPRHMHPTHSQTTALQLPFYQNLDDFLQIRITLGPQTSVCTNILESPKQSF